MEDHTRPDGSCEQSKALKHTSVDGVSLGYIQSPLTCFMLCRFYTEYGGGGTEYALCEILTLK